MSPPKRTSGRYNKIVLDFLCLALLLTPQLTQSPPSFHISASYVRVPVTVFDEQGHLMENLSRSDFQVFDEGEATPIINFVHDKAPISVLLLLDSSGSLKDEVEEIKVAALRFAESFGREDRISIVGFSDETVVLTPWTNRISRLRKGVKKLKKGYRTAIYDALADTIGEHFSSVGGRKVIILLTDGLDNESVLSYQGILNRLIRSQITLYIVSRTRLVHEKVRDSNRVSFLNDVMRTVLEDEEDFVDIYFREKESAMVHLAEATGGRVLFPEVLGELSDSYAQVARELKHQYLLTFLPPETSSATFRSIRVECRIPDRQIYFRRQYAWVEMQ